MAVLGLGLAAAGSATSSSESPPPAYQPAQQQAQNQPPPPQQMEGSAALGLWRSTFGAVKIEADNNRGGIQAGAVQGVWVYQRQGQEVVGYFAGNLRGNVLDFRWQEPNNPPLTGAGFLVFDPQGRQYSGRWWSDRRDRVGDWNGWRQGPAQQDYGTSYSGSTGGAEYGGSTYAAPPAMPTPSPYAQPAAAPAPAPYTPQPYYAPAPRPY